MIFFSVKFSWAQPSWNSAVVENARGVTNLSNHVVETARKKHIVNKAGREILWREMATDIDQRLIDIQREYVDFLDDGVGVSFVSILGLNCVVSIYSFIGWKLL